MMNKVSKAKKLSLKSSSPGWVLVGHASTLGNHVPIDAINSSFFDCDTGRHPTDPPPRFGNGPHPAVHVTKNVYNLTPIFLEGAGLVVNAPVRDLLLSCCTCEFQEVIIDKAFWFPYQPGDSSYQSTGIDLRGDLKEIIDRFVELYACDPLMERFYRLIIHTEYSLKNQYDDVIKQRVGEDMPLSLGAYGRDVFVSKRMIKEHGIIFGGGYICREDVFEILKPYFHQPWFWFQKYAFPESIEIGKSARMNDRKN